MKHRRTGRQIDHQMAERTKPMLKNFLKRSITIPTLTTICQSRLKLKMPLRVAEIQLFKILTLGTQPLNRIDLPSKRNR